MKFIQFVTHLLSRYRYPLFVAWSPAGRLARNYLWHLCTPGGCSGCLRYNKFLSILCVPIFADLKSKTAGLSHTGKPSYKEVQQSGQSLHYNQGEIAVCRDNPRWGFHIARFSVCRGSHSLVPSADASIPLLRLGILPKVEGRRYEGQCS